MGAWGSGPFENDDAGDWVWELEEAEDWSVVREALDAVTGADDADREAPECSCALAAAEIVAASLGRPTQGLPDEVTEWLDGRGAAPADLVALARRAVAGIGAKSELRELWAEADGAGAWADSLRDLDARLAGGR